MKVRRLEIEKMIPIEDEGWMNVRFHLDIDDPAFDVPFGMQITVGVPLNQDATYTETVSAALDKLHAALQGIAASSRGDLEAARTVEAYTGFPPTL